jgi:hypothetical protein
MEKDEKLAYCCRRSGAGPFLRRREEKWSAAAFGTAFLQRGSHLYMKVPSTIIHEATNVVINPCHPAFDEVKLTIVRSFSFDPRMFRRG